MSPPSQTPFSLLRPAPGDAAFETPVVVLVARSSPVYGFGYNSGFQPSSPMATATTVGVALPYWFLAAVAGVLPLVRAAGWYAGRRRARLAGRGVCVHCGYDLRATPERGGGLLDRCPECGRVPAPAEVG